MKLKEDVSSDLAGYKMRPRSFPAALPYLQLETCTVGTQTCFLPTSILKKKKPVCADHSEALGFDLSSVRDTAARRLVPRPPGCMQAPAGVCREAGHQKLGPIGTVPAQYK